MRSRNRLFPSLGLASAVGLVGLVGLVSMGCRDDVRVINHQIHQGPPAGTLVDTPGNTGKSSPFEGNPIGSPGAAPSAIGGGPLPANPPTGANDEGNPNMSEEPLPVKPDADEQSAGTKQPPPITP
jgi:hypothetical protein